MPNWTDAQQAAIAARNSELLISAAAGSGKTAVLVEHVLQLLREGGDITRLLVITFTRAAAAELRERLTAAIEREAGDRHMRKQLLRVKRADICTLHVFCHGVIRRHFQAADIDPLARVGEGTALEPLRRRATDEAMEALCQAEDGDSRALVAQYGDAQIVEMAQALLTFLMAQESPWRWLAAHEDITGDAAFRQALLALQKECLLGLEGALQLCDQMDKLLTLPAAPVHFTATADADRLLATAMKEEARAGTLLNGKTAFATRAKAPKDAAFDAALADRYISLRERFKKVVKDARAALPSDIAQARADIAFTQPAFRALCALAKDTDRRFSAYKEARGLLDYNDLEHKALLALADERIRAAEGARYDAIFVDEYQDVSAIQEAVVRALHTPANRLFMVGDVKQSIYRFRLADPTLFMSKYDRFEDGEKAVTRRILLSSNFRSRANLLACVNSVFERAMRRGATEIEYDDNARLRPGLEDTGGPASQLHIITDELADAAPGEPAGEDESPESTGENKRGWMYEAQLAAKLIRGLVGRPLRDGGKPVRYRDCVILLRSASGRAPRIAAILADAGIPAYSDADARYFDLPEVRDMLNVLRVLDNPRQDVALLSALRCPCFGFTSRRLALIRLTDNTRAKPFHEAFFALRDTDADVRAACDKLDRWRFLAQSLPVDALIWQLLEETGLYALAGAQREGAARQANLRLLAERAQDEDAKVSLHAFVTLSELSRHVDDGRAAKELGESEDVVRIMTIHKSKGLEFPVVIMMELARAFRMPSNGELIRLDARVGAALKKCDDQANLTGHTIAGRAIACRRAREIKAEEARLLYVGMTRAKDCLMLLASPRSMGAAMETWALPAGDYAAGCAKCMLDWVGQALCEGLEPLQSTSYVARGGSRWSLHIHATSDFVQTLPAEPSFVPPKLTGEVSSLVRERMERRPARTPRLKTSVTALLRGQLDDDEEETPESKRRALRMDTPPPALPAFMRSEPLTAADRGIAAHKALGLIDLRALSRAENGDLRHLLAENLQSLREDGALSQTEADAVNIRDIERFLRSDLGQRLLCAARRGAAVRREDGFVLLHQGTLVQGVPDLCFVECADEQQAHKYTETEGERLHNYTGSGGERALGDRALGERALGERALGEQALGEQALGEWVLVDYKTDRCWPGELPGRYAGQLRWYARALREITGLPVREMWLYSLRYGEALSVREE